jgi:hypothetical protein
MTALMHNCDESCRDNLGSIDLLTDGAVRAFGKRVIRETTSGNLEQ